MFIRFLSFLILSSSLYSKSLCDVLDLQGCNRWFSGGNLKSTSSAQSRGLSFPSTSSVSSTNPSRINTDRGFGVETIQYRGDYDFGVASGTGVVGGAFSSTTTEGSFFGNTSKELLSVFRERKLARKKLKGKKFTFATAFKIIGADDNDRFWKPTVNLGIISNYNEEVKKYGGGLGLSVIVGPFTLSGTRFSDTYRNPLNNNEIIKYYINTYSAGLRLFNISIEHTLINNFNDSRDEINLTTATVFTKFFMLTYGHRKEFSDFPRFDYHNTKFIAEREKDDEFGGIQFTLGKNFLLGFFYNYYLNRNGSVSFTAFF